MDLTALRYFVSAARLGSFTRAAASCRIAQPSLSQRIGRLEDELETPLFDRIGRGVVLTAAGHTLLEHAEPILAAVETAERSLRSPDDGAAVVIGAIPTIASFVLPTVIRDVGLDYPKVEFELYEDVTEKLVEKTLAGELDLAVVSLPLQHPRLNIQPLLEEPYRVALPADHPLAAKASISPAQLSGERFVMLHLTQSLGRQVMEFCHEHRFEPQVAGHAAQLTTVLALVAGGMGLSLVPSMACAQVDARPIVYRPLRGGRPVRTLGVIRHRHRARSPLVEEFEARLEIVASDRSSS